MDIGRNLSSSPPYADPLAILAGININYSINTSSHSIPYEIEVRWRSIADNHSSSSDRDVLNMKESIVDDISNNI
ncbi:unnamed protein product, partial [Rotaria sp. Silwood1]